MEGRGARRFLRAMTWLAMAFLYVPLAIRSEEHTV